MYAIVGDYGTRKRLIYMIGPNIQKANHTLWRMYTHPTPQDFHKMKGGQTFRIVLLQEEDNYET